jgi:glycosyltransferase involved in cell wall biosynthesis
VIHTPHGHIFYGYYGHLLTRLFISMERLAARLSDRIVTLTDREAEEHLERRIGRPEQFVTIPSGVDTDELRSNASSRDKACDELGLPRLAPIVMGIGRFTPIKGFDLLVRSLPLIAREKDDVRLVLVGDGPEKAVLEELATRLGVRERMIIAGARERVETYLAAADVLVAPSRNEGMGRSLVEAMALGVPTVGTTVGGIPNVVQDGENGFLVPPDQPQAISEAVLRLLIDGELSKRFSRAARMRAERFSLRVMEERLLALYQETSREKGILPEARKIAS